MWGLTPAKAEPPSPGGPGTEEADLSGSVLMFPAKE